MMDEELISMAHDAFRAEWSKADEEGDVGNRSRRGVMAVLDVYSNIRLDGVRRNAYQEGYDRGVSEGYSDGHYEGYQVGYDEGFIDGREA